MAMVTLTTHPHIMGSCFIFALLAVVTALIAIPAQHMIENPLPFSVGSDSVGQILDILASSMLAVTTFSLSVMVSAYTAASSSVTPRATKLVQQDTTTQNVLATFIGSFLYSLVGIIALSTDQYGENGRLILFIVTIGVIVLIVITILRWIEHLSQLGRVGETTERVENAAANTITQRIQHPTFGAKDSLIKMRFLTMPMLFMPIALAMSDILMLVL